MLNLKSSLQHLNSCVSGLKFTSMALEYNEAVGMSKLRLTYIKQENISLIHNIEVTISDTEFENGLFFVTNNSALDYLISTAYELIYKKETLNEQH